MEKELVLYEKGINFEKAHVRTLAGDQIIVSKVLIETRIPYFEIMVFEADNHGRVIDYNHYECHDRIYSPTIASLTFNDVIEAWSNETRTLKEIKPNHIVCS